MTVAGETRVLELDRGEVRNYLVAPEDLVVDSPQDSAEAVRRILRGDGGPRRDHALLNTAAALVVAHLTNNLSQGLQLAAEAVDDGREHETLERLVEVTNA